MTIASIDIGTNTILLLVAEIDRKTKALKPLLNEYRVPRIGRDLLPGGEISANKIKELTDILIEYKKISDSFSCEKIIAIATNALRIASNSDIIIARIKKITGVDISIIDGNKEAQFSFMGASGIIGEKETAAVIDIGGGSTEIIFGNSSDIFYKKSFPAGVVSLTERHFHHAPPKLEEFLALNSDISNIFCELIKCDIKINKAIAIAGTPTTLAAIKAGLDHFDEEKIEGSTINLKELNDLVQLLKKLAPSDILLKYSSVVEGREDILLTGSCILLNIMQLLKIDNILVSTKGIRYGTIIDYIITST